MRFQINHDYHIHTRLSTCSRDETQTTEALLTYAKKNGLKKICVTDHFWDETLGCRFRNNEWFEKQDFAHISKVKPLPVDPEVEFLFGCEADMDSDDTLGISPQRYDEFAFIVVATTHFHMVDGAKWEDRTPAALAKHWVQRLDRVLSSDLPLNKTGIAHLACHLISRGDRENYLATLDQIPTEELQRLFTKAAQKGVGIELNYDDMYRTLQNGEEAPLRLFRTAKTCGCKFYLGSDAHNHMDLARDNDVFERVITLLDLQESDKFHFE